jgi:hypothetical protein
MDPLLLELNFPYQMTKKDTPTTTTTTIPTINKHVNIFMENFKSFDAHKA